MRRFANAASSTGIPLTGELGNGSMVVVGLGLVVVGASVVVTGAAVVAVVVVAAVVEQAAMNTRKVRRERRIPHQMVSRPGEKENFSSESRYSAGDATSNRQVREG